MNNMINDERWNRLEYIIEEAVPQNIAGWRFRYSRQVAAAVEAAGFQRSERALSVDDLRAIEVCIEMASTAYGHYDDAQGALNDIHMMLAPIVESWRKR